MRRIEFDTQGFHVIVINRPNRLAVDTLKHIGASREITDNALRVIGGLNEGLTYTNTLNRTAVVLIGNTTSTRQFFNTYAHECDHLKNHICLTNRIDPTSEEAEYILGEIVERTYPIITEMMDERFYNIAKKFVEVFNLQFSANHSQHPHHLVALLHISAWS